MSDDSAENINQRALHSLIGLRPGNALKDALVTLFRSSAPIAPEVREALAQALERNSDDPGLRLTVEGAGKGGADDIGKQLQIRERWLIAGRRIEELHAAGMGVDDAKREVRTLRDSDGDFFGYGPSQAADAWAFFRLFRAYQALRNWQRAEARKNDTETESEQEAAFIIMAIYGGDRLIANPSAVLSGQTLSTGYGGSRSIK